MRLALVYFEGGVFDGQHVMLPTRLSWPPPSVVWFLGDRGSGDIAIWTPGPNEDEPPPNVSLCMPAVRYRLRSASGVGKFGERVAITRGAFYVHAPHEAEVELEEPDEDEDTDEYEEEE